MPSKKRRERYRRPCWLGINVIPDKPTSKSEMGEILLDSIMDGKRILPEGWYATIRWRNSLTDPWREDDWYTVLTDSAQNGRGFDEMVSNFVMRKFF